MAGRCRKASDVGKTSAQDDNAGVEQVNDMRQPARQAILVRRKRLARFAISVYRSRDDLAGRKLAAGSLCKVR